MPANFNACAANGGRVRTKELGNGKYIHICYPKNGGGSIAGEVKTKKNKKK